MPYSYTKNEQGLYICPDCDKTTEKQNTMHYHRKTHEQVLPFACKLCPSTVPLAKRQFLQAQTLANHVSAKHSCDSSSTLLTCPECPVQSLTKANRIIHYVRKHCSIKQDTLACPSCEKVCKSGTAYAYHLGTCKAGPIADLQKQATLELIR